MTVKTTLDKKLILHLLEEHAEKIKEFGVVKLGLFGSVVRGEETAESDVDILVDFEQGKKNYDNFINLVFLLEDLFQEKVDLVTRAALSDRMKACIEKEIEYVSFDS